MERAETADGCLNGLRVLDLTEESGQLAGRILADLGADVLKIEPPGGDPLRRKGAMIDEQCSAAWFARNAGKRSRALDLRDDAERVRSLATAADVVIVSFLSGTSDDRKLGWAALRELNPRLVFCSITPYGQSGPNAKLRGSDLTAIAASGNLFMTGEPDRAPLRCSLPVSHYHGGAEAAAGILMALCHRDRSGAGQHVDVSLQETMMVTSMSHPAQNWVTGYKGKRSGACSRVGEVVMREIWPCKDGFITFALRGGAARIPGMLALVKYMDEHGMAPDWFKNRDWKSYNHNRATQAEIEEIAAPFAAFFKTKTMQELYDTACERNLMLAPANTEREVLASRQLESRQFFAELTIVGSKSLRMPGRFANWSLCQIGGMAPSLAEAGAEFSGAPFAEPSKPLPAGDGPGLFAGLKILEFGAGAAIPLATRYFADQGATVIKIESRQRPDFLRILRDDGSGKVDDSLFFNILNCNKLSASLNMRDARAVALAKRLIGWADIVVENFSPGVMKKWGLDYETLKPEFPNLIMVSTCLWGQTGPERAYPGFGGQGSALAGFNYLTGWTDREPLGPFGTITDSLSPRFAALSISAALLRRTRTGAGSFVDLSQVEAGIYCLSEWLLAYQASGETFGRIGNRSPYAAPHGVFPTVGDDRWIALAIHDDDDWMRLRSIMESPAWAKSPALDSLEGRLAQVEHIEAEITKWTRTREPEELVHELQAEGLDAALVANLPDLHSDPQLAERGHFPRLVHPVIGQYVAEANGIRFSAAAHRFDKPAPCLGEHSELVFRDMLGLSAEEFAELSKEGVLS